LWLEKVNKAVSFEIPILQDLYGQTPLDVCLGIRKLRAQEKQFFLAKRQAKVSMAEDESAVNLIMADLILENLAEYGVLHSSQQILDAVIQATRIGLPSIKLYLESRLKKTLHPMLQPNQRRIRQEISRSSPAMGGDYGLVTAPVLGTVTDITSRLF